MEEYIVKIKSFIKEDCIDHGTGIVIGHNLVLTAKHVVVGDVHHVVINDKDIKAEIILQNSLVSVLKVEDNIFSNVADAFCIEEIFDESMEWEAKGFITSEQVKHSVKGNGMVKATTEEPDWDYYLCEIKNGRANDYSGMSGAPVFCNNRIVGILQIQSVDFRCELGVKMSSVSMFLDLLDAGSIKENECKLLVKEACKEHTLSQINKNLKSRKYIPDIFVEEGEYKEQLRHFADPHLFLKKTMKDISDLNFKQFNDLLENKKEKLINFNELASVINANNGNEILEEFYAEVCYAENTIDNLDKGIYSSQADSCEFSNLRQNIFNNGIKHFLWDIKDKMKFANKRYLLLTKDAGQGKTNFVCDFTSGSLQVITFTL